MSHEDFRTLSGIVSEIESKDKIRIDLFSDGDLPYLKLSNYDAHSKKLLSLDHIDIYAINLLDFVLTKAIAGRIDDYRDIEKIVKNKNNVPKEKLVKRFNEIELEKEKKKELKRKFRTFIKEFYKD